MRCQLDGAIAKHFASAQIDLLKSEDVVDFYMTLKRQGLAHSTIRHYHFTFCLALDTWCEASTDRHNPARSIKKLSRLFPRQAPTREINFLIPEELEILFEFTRKSKSQLLHPFIQFLAYTGMRRSEALNLKWVDIDENSGFIHVRKSKNGTARPIPLEEGAIQALRLLPRKAEYVFIGKNGKRLREGGFLKPLRTAARRAGIQKRIDIHTFRHAYGSNKIRQGWGLKKVSMILGHADITVTAKVYTHLLDGDLKVRDEYRFDNSGRKENSLVVGMDGSRLTPEEIMTMI